MYGVLQHAVIHVNMGASLSSKSKHLSEKDAERLEEITYCKLWLCKYLPFVNTYIFILLLRRLVCGWVFYLNLRVYNLQFPIHLLSYTAISI